MAQPFEERLATALRTDRSNCETLRELIAETRNELEQQLGNRRKAEKEAVDVTLNESEREDAAAAAARAKRLAAGYEEAIDTLQAKLSTKEASDRRRRESEERAAAEAECLELATEFETKVLPLLDLLPDLFSRILANEARLRAAGSHRRDAEAEARNVPGNYRAAGPIDRFTKMKIPNWGGQGRCWPRDPGGEQRVQIDEQARLAWLRYEQTKSPKALRAKEEAAAREEAKWTTLRVIHRDFAPISGVEHRYGQAYFDSHSEHQLQMSAEQIAAARARGLTVEPVSAEVTK